MGKYPGIGERIIKGLEAIGYWKKGKPDIMRFALEKQYVYTYLYRWIREQQSLEAENLLRLARDLQVSPEWLLFGESGESAGENGAKLKPVKPRPSTGSVAVRARGPRVDRHHRSRHIMSNTQIGEQGTPLNWFAVLSAPCHAWPELLSKVPDAD